MSLLRKLLNAGMMFSQGEGWKIHPLGTNCVAVELADGRAYLTDGERQKMYPDLSSALETKVTRRKFLLGEK
jgi:hypothetical protein